MPKFSVLLSPEMSGCTACPNFNILDHGVDTFRRSSYWKRCGDTLGIKIGAVAIPAATITLRKDSSSGALRFYFRDSNMKSVGDPVTMSFQNGTFSNGSHTIEITASDGFHNQVDFNTYQLGATGAWELEVLEAKDEMEPRANFSLLFKTVISPALR